MRTLITVLILSLATLSAHAEPDPAALARQFNQAYQAENWPRAAEIAEQFAAIEGNERMGAYNAACAHSLAGNLDQACDWLITSAEHGFSGVRSLQEDPDLANIRDLEAFQTAYALVKANTAKRFAEFKALFTQTDIITIEPDDYIPDSSIPLLIVLHGAGGTPQPIADLYKDIANEFGMLLVVPSALRPWGDGFGWTYRDESEWVPLHLIERYQESHNIDPTQVYLAGFSQGANAALTVGLKHPDKFAGVFPVCAHYDPDVMPIADSPARPPFYIMVGARDPFAHTNRDAIPALKAANFPVRLRINQATGHAYPANAQKELRKGFKYLTQLHEKIKMKEASEPASEP